MQRMFACHANMILLDIVIIEYFFYNWTLLQLNIMLIDIWLIAGIPPQMFSSHSRHFYYRTFCAFIGERRSEVLILTKERSDRAQDQEEDGGGGSLKEVLRERALRTPVNSKLSFCKRQTKIALNLRSVSLKSRDD